MGWEVRRGQRYYYRSLRVNGRVVKEYVGAGEVGEVAARLDAEAAAHRVAERAAWRHTLEELHQLDALFEQVDRDVTAYVSAVMTAAGFHRHRGEWRRKTVSTPDTPQPAPTPGAPPVPPPGAPGTAPDLLPLFTLPRSELVARARNGDAGAMAVLRPVFDEPGAADAYGGDMARRALRAAVHVVAGKDLVAKEATARKLEQLRDELAGPNPSPVERMLVENVVSTWFHLHNLERQAALEGEDNIVRAAFWQKALTAAQNRYFATIRELTKCRQAQVRPVQVNIAHEQVNVLNAPKG